MSLFLIVLAAGDGNRLKNSIPKQYIKVNQIPILKYSINAFSNIKNIKKIVVVYKAQHQKYIDKLNLPNVIKVKGGKSRQESTFLALKKIKKMNCSKVLIHDAARPNPPKKLIMKVIDNLQKKHVVIPVINVSSATKRIKKNMIFKNINRKSLRFSQTPQGFTFNKIYEKHKNNLNEHFDDDSALFVKDKQKILSIKGSKFNIKITDKEDLDIFKSLKKGKNYFGIGFDIHKLVIGKDLFLGGVKIPFKLGLEGHSDADPVLHALIDSLLGAASLGDIGNLFSNKNKKFKNIRSTILLKRVIDLIRSKKLSINNIDINIITEKPKIKKYVKKIISKIAIICGIKDNQINVKGKTAEKIGLIGNGNAIASEVISSISKYD
jgi:2-C-methyl-D-erythritol 4-phosphate cytidylyltransferase / 2-C-methyl-D-erythritol 2,4-cyclodiphosphate synthase